jgi:RNA polymerase sigma factor (sigma-70 family)
MVIAEKQHREFIAKVFDEPEYQAAVKMAIYRTIPSINRIDLDDLISEVWAVALLKTDLETHPSVHGWLGKTAKHMAKRFLSKQSDVILFSDTESTLKDSMWVEKLVEDKTLRNDLEVLLKQRLSPSEWRLYEMKCIEKLKHDEIASKIGKSKAAVDTMVSRLKEKVSIFVYIL